MIKTHLTKNAHGDNASTNFGDLLLSDVSNAAAENTVIIHYQHIIMKVGYHVLNRVILRLMY